MADKLPTLRCPLKMQGLMSNPGFVQGILDEPGYFNARIRDHPELVKCDREKCGFYASYLVTEEVDDEDADGNVTGVREEQRRVEGCSLGLIPERLERLSDLGDEVEDLAGTARTTTTLLAGAARVAAEKFGLQEEMEKLLAEAEAGDEEGEEVEGEPEEVDAEA